MSEVNGGDRIDDVAAGDVITLHQTGFAAEPRRVVHVDPTEGGYLVTLEGEGGDMSDVVVPSGTSVTRALESKWGQPQTPSADT